MATSSADSVRFLGATLLKISAGATMAQLVSPVAGTVAMSLQYVSGGTLVDIVGTSYGGTLTAAALVSAQNNAWRLTDLSKAFDIEGPASFYVMCQGATGVFQLLYRRNEGDAPRS